MKFSLILPVYNVAKFLPDCLASLYDQKLPETDYEIICVDDGSGDDSADVIAGWQKNHANLILLRQSNSGVGVARNRGLDAARGEYVWFIDPDDMIASDCLPEIYALLQAHHADIFEIRHYRTCKEEEKFVPGEIIFGIDGIDRMDAGPSGCLQICRRDYLIENHISFDPRLHYGEDYLWVLQTKYRRNHNIYTNTPLYVYRQRTDSAMHSADTGKIHKHMEDMLLLHDIYGEEYERCRKENLGEAILDNLKKRRQLCLEAALFYLLKRRLPGKALKETLCDWKRKGYYPYRPLFWNLGLKSVLGSWPSRVFKFFFPFEWYFRLACACYRLRGK